MNDSKGAGYHTSTRAIGRSFRAIELPALDIVRSVNRAQRKKLRAQEGEEGDGRLLAQFGRISLRDYDQIDVAVYGRTTEFLDGEVKSDHRTFAFNLFDRYTTELEAICAANTISFHRDAMLTEEEAAVGTIVPKTSQPRFRLNMMSELKDQTGL